jgi:hypothetical protein
MIFAIHMNKMCFDITLYYARMGCGFESGTVCNTVAAG